MSRGTQAIIHLDAVQHNFSVAHSLAPNSKRMAVVKADGYGHGAQQISKALHNSDGFAVATLAEAEALHIAGINQNKLLLEGVANPDQLQKANDLNLWLVVHKLEQIDWLTACSLPNQHWNVWLKVDTGMHRLGLPPNSVPAALTALSELETVASVTLMTHFARADEIGNAHTQRQIQLFNSLTDKACETSLCNSPGIFFWPEAHGSWIRPGIMLYGASPSADKTAKELGLKPAMTLNSPIIDIHQIKAGESVGYGGRWTAKSDSVIATLAIGYGDGYPRHAPNNTPVWINGKIAKLVGTVSMDMLCVDISNLEEVQCGDIAELWGANLPVDEVAKHCGTIGYELLTRVMPRVEKVYL